MNTPPRPSITNQQHFNHQEVDKFISRFIEISNHIEGFRDHINRATFEPTADDRREFLTSHSIRSIQKKEADTKASNRVESARSAINKSLTSLYNEINNLRELVDELGDARMRVSLLKWARGLKNLPTRIKEAEAERKALSCEERNPMISEIKSAVVELESPNAVVDVVEAKLATLSIVCMPVDLAATNPINITKLLFEVIDEVCFHFLFFPSFVHSFLLFLTNKRSRQNTLAQVRTGHGQCCV
jgi:hypothetical protein